MNLQVLSQLIAITIVLLAGPAVILLLSFKKESAL